MEMTKNLKSRDETDRISLSLQVNQVITKLGNELLAAKNDAMDRDRQMMSLLLKVVTQQKLHDTMITQLWEYIRALESTIKIVSFETSLSYTCLTPDQYRPSAVAVVVRTELDQARFYLAKTILLCFPQHFSEDRIINSTDLCGMSSKTCWKLIMASIWTPAELKSSPLSPRWTLRHSLVSETPETI